MIDPLRRNVWLSAGALFTSLTTLVCCVLPAVLVSIGAGVTVVGLVTAFPQLVWLSERKVLVFGVAGAMLLISGLALRHARNFPCPADPALAAACERLRRLSAGLFAGSAVLVVIGALAAFVLPILSG
ncbi:MAG: hypothetical protein JNK40_08840 [Chromatiales bacterium]|nr:hypothetical protein [Chromatiales bacterium]